MSATLTAALAYARRGWPVLLVHGIRVRDGRCTCGADECPNPGKHPRSADGQLDATSDPVALRHGHLEATTDPAALRSWLAIWPRSNVAVRTGAVSGLVVLDVDPRHGGADSLARLEAEHGPLPRTLTVRTGGGGEHRYFRHPGSPVPSSAGRVGAGLDVRGDGASLVVPPSLHVSGRRYWHAVTGPVAALPRWLLALAVPPRPSLPARPVGTPANVDRYTAAALDGEVRRVVEAVEGTRNATLNRAAYAVGQLVGAGLLDEGDAVSSLTSAAVSVGLAEREAVPTIRSGLRAGARSPRQVA